MPLSKDGQQPPSELSSSQRPDWSELADKSYLDLQVVAKPLLHLLLGERDQLANIFRGGVSEIDHDIRVNMRNLCITVTETLQTDLIDQPSGADAFNLLEDRARAGVIIEPRVLAAPPGEIFLHDAVHDGFVAPIELESHGKRDITLLVECAGIVTELHIVPVDSLSPVIVGQQLCRL